MIRMGDVSNLLLQNTFLEPFPVIDFYHIGEGISDRNIIRNNEEGEGMNQNGESDLDMWSISPDEDMEDIESEVWSSTDTDEELAW